MPPPTTRTVTIASVPSGPSVPRARAHRRLERAKRVRFEGAARPREGPRPGAAADPGVLAAATAALELRRVAQAGEDRVVAVERDDVVAAHVAGREWQEARREDEPVVRDEHDPVAVAPAHPGAAGGGRAPPAPPPRGPHPRGGAAPVLGRLCRLDREGRRLREVVQPVAQLLGLAGIDLAQAGPAAPLAKEVV